MLVFLLYGAGVNAEHSNCSVSFILKRVAYSSTKKVTSLNLVFLLPPLYSPVVVSMMKDGEHDKTQMVNKRLLIITMMIILMMMMIMMVILSPLICPCDCIPSALKYDQSARRHTHIASSASYLLMHANVLIW